MAGDFDFGRQRGFLRLQPGHMGAQILILAAKNTPADVAAALESETIQRRIDFIEAKLDESLAQHSQLF